MLRWLKTVVVSDEEKASKGVRWGLGRRSSLNHRKILDDIKTGVSESLRDKPGGSPCTGQAVSGEEVTRAHSAAFVRNVRRLVLTQPPVSGWTGYFV
jgi:hypothetical protein